MSFIFKHAQFELLTLVFRVHSQRQLIMCTKLSCLNGGIPRRYLGTCTCKEKSGFHVEEDALLAKLCVQPSKTSSIHIHPHWSAATTFKATFCGMLTNRDPLVSLLCCTTESQPIRSSFRSRELPLRVTELVGYRRQLHCVA
jgi:hypothetical protein